MENVPAAQKKILFVDDNNLVREIYEQKFKEEGFEVVIASDGQEGWEIIERGTIPDLVMTGIIMPRMTGFELVKKLQADKRLVNIPVVICSHRNRPEDRKTATELGVDLFIAQGITPIGEIMRKVKLLFGLHSSYTISVTREKEDAAALVRLLSMQQDVSCPLDKKEITLDIEPQTQAGEFKIHLRCE